MAEDAEIVKSETRDGVTTLTLNRPDKRNALSSELLAALEARLAEAKADDAVRVVVLTGAGDRAFCAGGDLGGAMTGGGGGFPAQIAGKGRYADLLRSLGRLGKPVVARLNGDAMGGGVGLMLACDLVVAADDARIGLPEVKVGLWPMMVTALLVRHVGRKVALEMMLLGEKLGAAEAKARGLVNRVVPRAELDVATATLTATLAGLSPATLKLGLDAFHQTEDLALDAALDSLRDRLVLNTLLEDAAEGVMAFVQRRTPEWKGR